MKTDKSADQENLVEVFASHDLGEQAFARSLLESQGIHTFEPNFNAERMAIWTTSLIRRFSVYVMPKDAAEAHRLVRDYINKQGEKPSSGRVMWLSRVLLVVVLVPVIVRAVSIIQQLLNR